MSLRVGKSGFVGHCQFTQKKNTLALPSKRCTLQLFRGGLEKKAYNIPLTNSAGLKSGAKPSCFSHITHSIANSKSMLFHSFHFLTDIGYICR